MRKQVLADGELAYWNNCETCEMLIDQIYDEYPIMDFEYGVTRACIEEFMFEKYGSWELADKAMESCKKDG